MAVTDKIIEKEAIGIEDEIFVTGLFINHIGKQKNLPIIRTCNIALMPEELVNTKHLGDIDAYLMEARSKSDWSAKLLVLFFNLSIVFLSFFPADLRTFYTKSSTHC